MYTARLQGVTLTNTPTCLWEISPNNTVSVLLHSVRLDFSPSIVSGVAQDSRVQITISTLATIGSGGGVVTPTATHPRNTTPSTTFTFSMLTTPGTVALVRSADNVPAFTPYERIYTPEQRLPIPAGTHFGIFATQPLSAVVMSGELTWEEF
jgi:hypothetical protein